MQKEMQDNPCNTIKSSNHEESETDFTENFTKPESQPYIEKKHEWHNHEKDNNIRQEGGNKIRCFVQGFKF